MGHHSLASQGRDETGTDSIGSLGAAPMSINSLQPQPTRKRGTESIASSERGEAPNSSSQNNHDATPAMDELMLGVNTGNMTPTSTRRLSNAMAEELHQLAKKAKRSSTKAKGTKRLSRRNPRAVRPPESHDTTDPEASSSSGTKPLDLTAPEGSKLEATADGHKP